MGLHGWRLQMLPDRGFPLSHLVLVFPGVSDVESNEPFIQFSLFVHFPAGSRIRLVMLA